jgi:hypothetical protein
MSKAKTHPAKPLASTLRTKTESQCSTPHPDTRPNPQSQSDPVGSTPMEIAYAEYQQARALLGQADIDVSASPPSLNEEERLTEAMERLDASEWKIVQTRAENGLDVRLRAMALHQVFLDAEMNGAPTDNRHQMMLVALIYDVFDARFDWRAE